MTLLLVYSKIDMKKKMWRGEVIMKGNKEYTDYHILEHLPISALICEFNEKIIIKDVNKEFENQFNFTKEKLYHNFQGDFLEMIHPIDRRDFLACLHAEEEYRVLEVRIISSDGTYRWFTQCMKLIETNLGFSKFLFIFIERPDYRNESPSDNLNMQGDNQKSDILFEWDIINDTMSYSENWLDKFGYMPLTTNISKRLPLSSHIHDGDSNHLTDLMKNIKSGVQYYMVELRLQDIDKNDIWCRLRVTNQYDEEGNPIKAIGILSDIHDEKIKLENLQERAERDALTGLLNREEAKRQMNQYFRTTEATSALLMIDTDNFKTINDTQGHLFGDAVLSELATAMKRSVAKSGIVGRIGGDEFVILLKDITSIDEIKEFAENLLSMFKSLFEKEKNRIEVTCSIGIAQYPQDGTDFESLYRNADTALYQAKNEGKNRYHIYDKETSRHYSYPHCVATGTHIDSNQYPLGGVDDLVNYVFQILYDTQDVDSTIELILEIVGKRFDVSRAYVFENSEDGCYVDNTYEWCNEGIEPQKEHLQHFPYEVVAGYEKLFSEQSIFYCRDIYTLTPDKIALFESQGICSTLQCAMRSNNEFSGFVGFDECTGLRLWTKEEIGMLSLIAQILSMFLQKKRQFGNEQQLIVKLNTILDTQDAYLYAIDYNHTLLYMNRRMKNLDKRVKKGEKCYRTFFDQDRPCYNCPLKTHNYEIYNDKYKMWIHAQVENIQWGEDKAYLVSCFDITEYKKLQK